MGDGPWCSSGDTKFSENLIRFAQGADVVVHSVAAPEVVQRGRPPERAKAILDHHTLPEEAGTVFARVQPKLAVFSHIVLPEATAQDLIPPPGTLRRPLRTGGRPGRDRSG